MAINRPNIKEFESLTIRSSNPTGHPPTPRPSKGLPNKGGCCVCERNRVPKSLMAINRPNIYFWQVSHYQMSRDDQIR